MRFYVEKFDNMQTYDIIMEELARCFSVRGESEPKEKLPIKYSMSDH